MKLSDVLQHIGPTVGLSSLIGAPESVASSIAHTHVGIVADKAREKLAEAKRLTAAAPSDYAYWGYAAQVSYWQMVCHLMEAAELVGPDNLPDVPLPGSDGIVMDLMAQQERFGREVLARAKAM